MLYFESKSFEQQLATCLSLLDLTRDENGLSYVEQRKSARRKFNTSRRPCVFLLGFIKQPLHSGRPKKSWTQRKERAREKDFICREQGTKDNVKNGLCILLLQTKRTTTTKASRFVESWQLSLKKLDQLSHCLKFKINMFDMSYICLQLSCVTIQDYSIVQNILCKIDPHS